MWGGGTGPLSFDPMVVGNRETDAWSADLGIDPARAALLEVEWWRVRRARQHDSTVDERQLETALVDLYAYVYSADRTAVLPAAQKRVEATDLSDRWVRTGCALDDPLLAEERRALVASYAALRVAVER